MPLHCIYKAYPVKKILFQKMASVQKIESEGYDATFVNEVDEELKCAVCHLVLRDPIQLSECGHRFCHGCLRGLEKYAERLHTPLLCPVDRDRFDVAKVFSDKGIARTIGNLKVRCSHVDCGVVVDLRELEAHMVGCQHRTVKAADVMDRLRRCEDNMKAKDAEIFQLNISVAELRAENVEMRSQLASFISTSNKKVGSKKKSSSDPKFNQDSSLPKKRKLSSSTRGVSSQLLSISTNYAEATPSKLESAPALTKTYSAPLITKKKKESILTVTDSGAECKRSYETTLADMSYLSGGATFQQDSQRRNEYQNTKTDSVPQLTKISISPNKRVGYINKKAPIPKFLKSPIPLIEDDPPTPKKGLLQLTRLSSHQSLSKTSAPTLGKKTSSSSTKVKPLPFNFKSEAESATALLTTTDPAETHRNITTKPAGKLPKAKSDPILKQYGTRRAKTNAAAIIKSKYEATSTTTEEPTQTEATSEATLVDSSNSGPVKDDSPIDLSKLWNDKTCTIHGFKLGELPGSTD